MKLKKNHWMLWCIQAVFKSYDYPKTLCTFFWKWFISFLSLIIVFPFTIYMLCNKERRENPTDYTYNAIPIGIFVILMVVIFLINILVFADNITYYFTNIYWIYPLTPVVLITGGIIVVKTSHLLLKIFKKIFKKKVKVKKQKTIKENRQSFFYIFKQWFKSKKDKVCPIMEYIEEE